MSLRGGLCGFGCLVLGLALRAEEPATNIQFSAFGTLALTATGTHQVGFTRDTSQPATVVDHPVASGDSRFGVQLSTRLSETLLGTLQVVSRQQYDNTYRPQVEWACLTWNPNADWQIKGGRIGLETLPNGDFANVGYTYLWVRPPVEEFGVYNNFTLMDGLDLTRSFELRNGSTIDAQFLGGFADEKEPENNPAASSYDLTGSYLYGLALKARRGGFQGKLSYVQSQLAQEYAAANAQAFASVLDAYSALLGDPRPAQVADELKLKGTIVRVAQLSGAWARDQIQAQAGVSRILQKQLGLADAWTGFASFGYRMGSVVPYAVWSRAVSERRPTPDLGLLATLPGATPALVVQAVADAVHSRDIDQTTWSAGMRWDFADQACLKLQVDRVGAHNATGTWRVLEPGWDGKATVMTVALDFILGGVR